MKYSESEEIVLKHFFTNIDKNVYCATDNMPIMLWGLLLGGYSRSALSMRDRFLQIFKDISKNEQYSYEVYIKEFATNILNNSINNLVPALEKAAKFMEMWAVSYGHSSLKDSSFNLIAIENVSIRTSKEIEAIDLGAFQEKSTRYMDFSTVELYNTGFASLDGAMVVYNEMKEKLTEYYKSTISRDEFKTEGAWNRTCAAKAFDDARYLLPSSIKTSLGATIPTRETERWISSLLSSKFDEVVEVAELIKEECEKITPALIKHVSKNSFYNRKENALVTRLKKEIPSSTNLHTYKNSVEMLYAGDIEQLVRFNLLVNSGLIAEKDILESNISGEEVFELAFKDRGEHDELPKETAVGTIVFNIICDIGAYRDLQRHRKGTQIIEQWSTLRGYEIPEVLELDIHKELKEKYVGVFEAVNEECTKLINEGNSNYEYCTLLGNKINFIYECDFRQLAYIIELRSGESGHISYRKIAQEMYRLFANDYPVLSKHIRVNMNGYTDRRKQEERTEAKIQNAESQMAEMVKPENSFTN